MSPDRRVERDSLGTIEVPARAMWGPGTARALAAYTISGQPMPPAFLQALARIKRAAARANAELGQLDPDRARAIADAATRVVEGELREQFPIDRYQTGSGTATNMNMNEVLASLANEAQGGARGARAPIHPNDHVNHGQSSNDTIPTAIHLSSALAIDAQLLPALRRLHRAMIGRSQALSGVLVSGRTHLMDATPIRLDQVLGGWARQVEKGIDRVTAGRAALMELALGGTAVGTGMGRHPDLARRAIALLAEETGLPLVEAQDHAEAQSAMDAALEAHGQLEVLATSLLKIAGDLRLYASGPRSGLGELRLPALAPGSSIMPGKVNPVMCEVVCQVAARVLGNGASIRVAASFGQLQLHTGLPLLACALLESIELLASASESFAARAIEGLTADEARCAASLERNLSLATALLPTLGYDEATAVAREAFQQDSSVREVLRARGWSEEEVDRALEIEAMTGPG